MTGISNSTDTSTFKQISTTILGDILPESQAIDKTIRPIVCNSSMSNTFRLVGPAYPVVCRGGDILSLHAAVYFAPKGSVLVVDAKDDETSVLGGNFAMLAKKRGISGAVVHGNIRDVAEIIEVNWPVFCVGVCPVAGTREHIGSFNQTINCGGVTVNPKDVVVADKEGIMVIPEAQSDIVLQKAQQLAQQERKQTFEQWEMKHRQMVESVLGTSLPA